MDNGLLDLLNQTVTIAAGTGSDANGMPTYGTGITVNALVIQRQKLLRNTQGQEVVSTTQTFVAGTTAVTTSSKITLPDGTTPRIIAVAVYPDLDGACDHKVIYT